ncbi:endonuclease/Exonuclease/phosphatase [Loa loa]|uniref:phosphoinositide 5-phosphatase n=1 Tax=Loa loa TaxID=7209 RepID=A0A1I7VGD9_LOALO|nr:endonuclease/Exonuclease/phosphatase [Loa loa]EFO22572.2 endonuclease/Exonuclease/phosphatase [Loa loa]
MSHRFAIRIAYRDVPSEPYSITVESQKTKKMLLFQSSAITTIFNAESLSELRKNYTKLMDARGLLGVLRTGQDDAHLLAITEDESVGELRNCKIYRIWGVNAISLKGPAATCPTDPRINDVLRLFSSGSFYYASQDDASRCIDLTVRSHKCSNFSNGDSRFFWNKHLHYPLKRYKIDVNEWLLRIICGAVVICQVYVGQQRATVALISRLSCERVGTRFNVRGVDDDGHVANFVETEQVITLGTDEISFVQIRGSVPLFWEQPGINVGSHKVKLRAFEASSPAFNRHFRALKEEYGEVTVVNLLGSKEGETLLSKAYEAHYKNSNCVAGYISFDYHEEKRNCMKLMERLKPKILDCMFYRQRNGNVLCNQNGVIRVNCLDCLDRTNAVQTLIGFQVLVIQLESLEVDKKYFARFEEHLKDIWQRNGDSCSVIYAGTGALEGKSKMKDAKRTLVRAIQNNFLDASKQEAFEFLLHGTFICDSSYNELTYLMPRDILLEHPSVVKDLVERKMEMMENVPLTIWVGTWNVNGGKNFSDIAFRNQTNLSDWLFPQHFHGLGGENSTTPDMYVVGLEEIIDLNASNIVSASTTNQRAWALGLREALSKRNKYILLGCEQLVGVCIFVFIKPSLAAAVRDMSINSVKTGMGGTTGNKGSVAMSLTIYSTTFCFVCSHLAAGQNEVRDRNEDYMNALRKIKFSQGRGILSHVVVFWLGDFNYRIVLSRNEAEAAIKSGNMTELSRYDQLSQQKALGEIFKGFEEGPLTFAPTYKYDTFTDDYDTSEKCRVPAWTDRILWRETNGTKIVHLLNYDRIELKTSDHRPVCALFHVDAYKINLSRFELVFRDVVSSMGPLDGTVLVSVCNLNSFPPELRLPVIGKLDLFGISPSISKVESGVLWLIFNSCDIALAALSLDGVRIGDSILSVQLLTPDWAELEYAEMSNMLRNTNEDLNMECIELRNADNFEINDEDDLPMKDGLGDRLSRLRCNSPVDRNEMDLCQLTLPNVAPRSVSSPMLNDMQMYPSTNDLVGNINVQPKQPTALPVLFPEPVKFSASVCAPPPVPPRKESTDVHELASMN